MPLQTKTYEQALSDIVTTWAALLLPNLNPNLPSGDPLLAIFQAHVLCGIMFLQSQAVAVSNLTNIATCNGVDLDNKLADWGFPRQAAVQAEGSVQFSVRTVSTASILIPVGTIIQTADASIQYQVIADTNQAAWSVAQNAYILPPRQLSLNATVQALSAGTASNVQAGALNQLVSSVTGISFVTNLAGIQNGADPELDMAYRNRFKLFINSVNARTTPTGILSAAYGINGVVAVSLLENQDRYGNSLPGYGVVVIDDGSGSPPSSLINAVSAAIAATNAPVRGFTIQILVIGPTLSQVSVALNIRINPAALSPSTVLLNVENAVIDYVNSLEIGQELYLENISYFARGADPNVIAVQPGSVKINGSAADFTATSQTVIRTNNTMVTIGTY